MSMALRLPVAIMLGLGFAWTFTLAVVSWLPGGEHSQMAIGAMMAPLVWAVAITWMSLAAKPRVVWAGFTAAAIGFGAAAALHHWPLI